ncbi:catalase-2 [Bacillus thuringiensis Sbt003]|uniref:Catalase-2 n=1 Tax=Bacillus thuringiensis Sbt003 TaxID=1235825 RepID=A0A9X0FD95_BACTU|nr:catalase-2 [Bacillus thuringiensis Sbt003]
MITNTDVKISNDENSLTASDRFRTIRHNAGNAKGTLGSK